jgi:hypothetical protein
MMLKLLIADAAYYVASALNAASKVAFDLSDALETGRLLKEVRAARKAAEDHQNSAGA